MAFYFLVGGESIPGLDSDDPVDCSPPGLGSLASVAAYHAGRF